MSLYNWLKPLFPKAEKEAPKISELGISELSVSKLSISEPVLTILKALKERTETFELNREFLGEGVNSYRKYTVKDSVTDWGCTIDDHYCVWGATLICSEDWMTQDELKAVLDVVAGILDERHWAKVRVLEREAEERKAKERSKVVQLYKGE